MVEEVLKTKSCAIGISAKVESKVEADDNGMLLKLHYHLIKVNNCYHMSLACRREDGRTTPPMLYSLKIEWTSSSYN